MNDLKYEQIPFDDSLFPIRAHTYLTLDKKTSSLARTWHEQIEFLYFLKGGAEIQISDKTFIAEDEDVFLINSCESHAINYYKGSPLYHCIIIDTAVFSSASSIYDIKYFKPIVDKQVLFYNRIEDTSYFIPIFDKLLKELESKNFAYEIQVKSSVLQILTKLFRDKLYETSSPKERQKDILRFERLNPVLKYIEDNYAYEIKIEDLAKIAYLSVSHFSRLFKEITGKTTIRYINEYRIQKAEILLQTSNLSVSEIAKAVGFDSSSYFSKCLKDYRNLRPLDIRKKSFK